MNPAARCVSLVAAMCVSGPVLKAEEPAKTGLILTITPETRRIVTRDPLLVKVQIANPTRDSVFLDRPFQNGLCGYRIEVKGPQDADWVHAPGIMEGQVCLFLPQKPALKPRQSVADYVVINYGCDSDEVFAKPGAWIIRATSKTAEGPVVSQPVLLEVVTRSRPSQEALDACIEKQAAPSPNGHGSAEIMAVQIKSREALAGSNAGAMIDQAKVLYDLRLAGSARARSLALDEVWKHRATLSPVTREYFDLALAYMFFHRKEYRQARSIVSRIKESSFSRDSLQAQLDAIEMK